MNTHYAVITFSGDPASEHPDEDLCGQAPSMEFIACGPEKSCWDALARWTAEHPLRMWEEAEVLARDPAVVRAGVVRAAVALDDHDTPAEGRNREPGADR